MGEALGANDVTGGEGGKGGGTMRMTRWVLVGLIGLLVAGCASPTPTVVPTHTSSTPPVPTAMPVETPGGVTITILYDNNPGDSDERLETAWGFSCLVEGLEKTILFDTGGDSAMLLRNMRTLGLDPMRVNLRENRARLLQF